MTEDNQIWPHGKSTSSMQRQTSGSASSGEFRRQTSGVSSGGYSVARQITDDEALAKICVCGNTFLPDSAYCRVCGQSRRELSFEDHEVVFVETCKNCGNALMADSHFCRACGVERGKTPVNARDLSQGVRFLLPEADDIIQQSSGVRDSSDSLEGRNKPHTTSSFASYVVSHLLPTTEQAQEFSDDEESVSRSTSTSNFTSATKSLRESRKSGLASETSEDLNMMSDPLSRFHMPRSLSDQEVRSTMNSSQNMGRRSTWAGQAICGSSVTTPRRGSWAIGGHYHMEDLPKLCSNAQQFRILDRDAPFFQSCGRWAINNVRHVHTQKKRRFSASFTRMGRQEFQERENSNRSREQLAAARAAQELNDLHGRDFYHAFLDAPWGYQLGCFAAAYVFCFIAFAVLYLWMAEPCDLELKGDFLRAYMLSLETMTTIGYGVPDSYMNGCRRAAVVLTLQSFTQLLMGALLIGVIFQRLSRPQSRANTILFSEKAVIQQINGVLYFMFRVCDLRIRHALIEPHVRCYCLWKHPERGYEMVPMRLEHPDDEQGAPLLMTLPAMIVHRIDAWSPLAPHGKARQPKASKEAARSAHGSPRHMRTPEGSTLLENSFFERSREQHNLRVSSWPGPLQRQVDCETGNRNSCVCPTCGSTFGTGAMLQLHCQYNAAADVKNGIPEEACHKELRDEQLQKHTHEDPTKSEVEEYLSTVNLEVVILIEGIEPTTSSTLQARHSYIVGVKEPRVSSRDETCDVNATDIEWDMEFVECCKVPKDESKGLVIDLTKFHETRETDELDDR